MQARNEGDGWSAQMYTTSSEHKNPSTVCFRLTFTEN